MLHTIENDYLKVTVSDHGAELTSVYDKAQDFERIWCADPAVWNRHAPVLFPFVGKVKGGAYRYNGNTYAMKTQHGFARDAEFTCIEETTDSITHKLVYSDETLEIYPFEFELLITHRFDAENPRLLHVTWAVKILVPMKCYIPSADIRDSRLHRDMRGANIPSPCRMQIHDTISCSMQPVPDLPIRARVIHSTTPVTPTFLLQIRCLTRTRWSSRTDSFQVSDSSMRTRSHLSHLPAQTSHTSESGQNRMARMSA